VRATYAGSSAITTGAMAAVELDLVSPTSAAVGDASAFILETSATPCTTRQSGRDAPSRSLRPPTNDSTHVGIACSERLTGARVGRQRQRGRHSNCEPPGRPSPSLSHLRARRLATARPRNRAGDRVHPVAPGSRQLRHIVQRVGVHALLDVMPSPPTAKECAARARPCCGCRDGGHGRWQVAVCPGAVAHLAATSSPFTTACTLAIVDVGELPRRPSPIQLSTASRR